MACLLFLACCDLFDNVSLTIFVFLRFLSSRDDINRVVSYNYGSLVAIGSFDRHVKFLDVLTGHDTGPVITGHAGSIRCLYINDLKDYVLSGSYDTSIR